MREDGDEKDEERERMTTSDCGSIDRVEDREREKRERERVKQEGERVTAERETSVPLV